MSLSFRAGATAADRAILTAAGTGIKQSSTAPVRHAVVDVTEAGK